MNPQDEIRKLTELHALLLRFSWDHPHCIASGRAHEQAMALGVEIQELKVKESGQ